MGHPFCLIDPAWPSVPGEEKKPVITLESTETRLTLQDKLELRRDYMKPFQGADFALHRLLSRRGVLEDTIACPKNTHLDCEMSPVFTVLIEEIREREPHTLCLPWNEVEGSKVRIREAETQSRRSAG